MAWRRYEHEFGLLGPERGDFHAAEIAYYVIKALGGKKARVRFSDLLLVWGAETGGPDRRRALGERLPDLDEDDEDDEDDE